VPAPSDPIRLQLELDSCKDPIRGHVGNSDAEPIPFTGWLELMAAMERLRSASPHAPDRRQPAAAREARQGRGHR
jgi:hypothetical protein